MPGLVTGIHVSKEDGVAGRDKPGHDENDEAGVDRSYSRSLSSTIFQNVFLWMILPPASKR
jgi:hypothetical protein